MNVLIYEHHKLKSADSLALKEKMIQTKLTIKFLSIKLKNNYILNVIMVSRAGFEPATH